MSSQLIDQVARHLALILFAVLAIAIGAGDLWKFHEIEHQLSAWVDLALILAGLGAGGVQVSGVAPPSAGG